MAALRDFKKLNRGASLRWKLRKLKSELRYAWQRAYRGYDDCEVINMDYAFLDWAVAVLKDFELSNIGAWPKAPEDIKPDGQFDDIFMTLEETNTIVRTMREHFEKAREDYWDDKEVDLMARVPLMQENLDKGLELFGKYFYCLWI